MISVDNLQKKRLENALQRISGGFRDAAKNFDNLVIGMTQGMLEIAEAENALAAVSNYDLVFVLRPVAKELSELTGKRYIDILDQARGMILEGREIPDVLWHFDIMLNDLKHGRK